MLTFYIRFLSTAKADSVHLLPINKKGKSEEEKSQEIGKHGWVIDNKTHV